MTKSIIDKLMELKQLYEQGILTKEEMETEKQKILGSVSDAPKSESSQTIERQSHVEAKEPAKISVENTKDSFFYKYKGYVFGIALLLVIACIIFVPRKATQPDMTAEDSIPELKTFALKGMINNKIGFSMHLEYYGNEVEGTEHYDSQKSDVNVSIKGTIDEKRHMILREYDGNIEAGTFEGTMGGETYSGTFTNSKGKTFPFSANVLTESALAKIEEEKPVIIGLWNLSLVENGLEFNCDLGFDSFQKVKIKFGAKGFNPNLGSVKVIISEEGKYNIQGNTLITDWDSNTAKVSIADIQYTDSINDYIKEHPEVEKKIQDTANQLLKKMLMDIVSDMNLMNNKTTIYSISDKELIIGDSHQKNTFERTR